jgi:hypothetical protein
MNWCRMFTCQLISWCLCLRNIGRMYVHCMWSPQWAHLRGCTNLCYCIVEQILRNNKSQFFNGYLYLMGIWKSVCLHALPFIHLFVMYFISHFYADVAVGGCVQAGNFYNWSILPYWTYTFLLLYLYWDTFAGIFISVNIVYFISVPSCHLSFLMLWTVSHWDIF